MYVSMYVYMYAYIYIYIYIYIWFGLVWFGLVSLFNRLSTFLGYLMPNPSF